MSTHSDHFMQIPEFTNSPVHLSKSSSQPHFNLQCTLDLRHQCGEHHALIIWNDQTSNVACTHSYQAFNWLPSALKLRDPSGDLVTVNVASSTALANKFFDMLWAKISATILKSHYEMVQMVSTTFISHRVSLTHSDYKVRRQQEFKVILKSLLRLYSYEKKGPTISKRTKNFLKNLS